MSRALCSLASPGALGLVLGLTACGGGGGGDSAPASATTVKTLSITSSYSGVTYPITVYLPADYATSTNVKPVIYAMDDELEGNVIVGTVQQLKVDAIVVSIGSLGSDRRFIDFDLPGAGNYFKFLTLELVPRVEAEYRIDRMRRTLMGYSLSGLMAMVALLEDGPSSRYFSGYVMTDPSLQFHLQNLLDMEQALWQTTHDFPVTVHHCSSGGGPSAQVQDVIQARGYERLHYQFRLYNLNHADILAPCVVDGLRWVFGLH
jgi:predicted alpha/beta superfamily hydrolase